MGSRPSRPGRLETRVCVSSLSTENFCGKFLWGSPVPGGCRNLSLSTDPKQKPVRVNETDGTLFDRTLWAMDPLGTGVTPPRSASHLSISEVLCPIAPILNSENNSRAPFFAPKYETHPPFFEFSAGQRWLVFRRPLGDVHTPFSSGSSG